MSTLTLTLDDELLRQAEAYARRTGTDLSHVVAQALRPLVQPPAPEPPVFSPQVAALVGCISLPTDYDYRDARANDMLATDSQA